MVTQSPSQEEKSDKIAASEAGTQRRFLRLRSSTPRAPLGQILRELDWPILLLVGILGGSLWTFLLLSGNNLTFLAGLFPVGGGLLVGRRVRSHIVTHAILLSLLTTISAAVTTIVLTLMGVATAEFLQQVIMLGFVALLPFPAFGVWTAHQSEQRARLTRDENKRRGGKLERAGRVKSLDELRSLSLPQLAGYVADLFRKQEFKVLDYQFGRDNTVEFQMSLKEEPWIIRVTVDDKVKQGTVLQFYQRLKEEPDVHGVVITSMDFQDAAVRWAKDKRVVLIDGPTLLAMHE